MALKKTPNRNQVPKNLTWDLEKIYSSDQEWQQDFNQLEDNLSSVEKYAGKLAESSENLLKAIELNMNLVRNMSKLYVYSHLKNDQDTADNQYVAMEAQATSLYAKVAAKIAYFKPELLQIDEQKLKQFINENSQLQHYQFYIQDIIRGKEHQLSRELEQLLAAAGDIFDGSQKIYSTLTNADLKFGEVVDEDGNLIELSNGIYSLLLESSDSKVRQAAFDEMYKTYSSFKNTLAATLSQNTHMQNFLADIRHFNSAKNAALFSDNVEESVFDELLKQVDSHKNLLHRFVSLRKKILKLDKVRPYDLYTPIVDDIDLTFSYSEAQKIVLEALKPLGNEYLSIINQAFEERWIDVVENKGKRSGAYSSGSYDTNPYILMNWQDSIDSLFTLIHELGHSVHSYLTHKNQSFVYGNYPIFLAEIASTTNEELLTNYLLDKYQDDNDVTKFILNKFLDGFKGTVYRQTQFAEFELWLHQQDADGLPLTADEISEKYLELNQSYYGDDLTNDPQIGYEWSRIPHFYYNFYVFQYATGESAALSIVSQIKDNPKTVSKYLEFLSSGSVKYPLDTVKIVDVDMTKSDYLFDAFKVFEERLTLLEQLIEN